MGEMGNYGKTEREEQLGNSNWEKRQLGLEELYGVKG